MPSVITKTWGIPKMRSTLSSSKCLVVILKRTTKDTEVMTRVTNSVAPDKPWRVTVSISPAIFTVIKGSPGVKMLKMAGMAMKSENRGMNTQVLFKKNPKRILEKQANRIDTA